MLLAADIGNTNITVGIYDGEDLIASWVLCCDKNKTQDEYGIVLLSLLNFNLGPVKLEAAVISSVVPSLTEKFRLSLEKYFNIPVLKISSKTKTAITLDVENPKEVGCDRIANACAAYRLYGTPAVVVDFGTATNFDVVSSDGRFIGGIIAPGLNMLAESFSFSTNLLPKLKIEGIKSVIGKNTIQNMLSGVVVGHASMIDDLITRIEEELGSSVITIATGGFSSVVTEHMKKPFDYFNKNLTLDGLKLIYEINKNKIVC